MSLHLQTNTGQYLFTGHGEGYVAINGRSFRQAVAVMAGEVRTDWPATDFASLDQSHFDYFLPLKPDVLLLGTGARQQFARPELFRELVRAGISVEFMDTPAACRTYNILVAEDRKVVAAVLI
ncbi:MAG: Mth938-like domain-containing protein [Nitrosomonadales bacterium]|nr:Mth938-like domain-containing protein [Nitrosomonadales bacterium]